MSDENELTPGEHDGLWATVQSGAEHVDRRRRQRRGIITGALAVAIIAGVIGGVAALAVSDRDQVMAPSPSSTATTTPLPSRTATPTSAATPEPTTSQTPALSPTPPPVAPPEVPSGDDPSQWIVTDAGMGPLTLGMPFDEAVAAVPGAADACTFSYSAFDFELWLSARAATPGGPAVTLGVASWGSGPSQSLDYGPRTPEGIGIGSTEADVRATYPEAVEVIRQGLNLKVGNVFFSIPDGVVDSVGVTSDDIPYEYCG